MRRHYFVLPGYLGYKVDDDVDKSCSHFAIYLNVIY